MILSIPLPEKGKPLIKVGQQVDFTTPLFEEKLQKETRIYISQKIEVQPSKIFHHLKHLVGDAVKKGDILAEKKGLFSHKSYKSEFDGILKEVNHTDGSILIEIVTDDDVVTKAYFKGEVAELHKDEVRLKVNHAKEYEVKEAEQVFGGKVFYLPNEHVTIEEESVDNHVVVAESLSGYTQMKLEALGARGFVTLRNMEDHTDLPHAHLKQIADFEEAAKHKMPYCFILKKSSRIVFYS